MIKRFKKTALGVSATLLLAVVFLFSPSLTAIEMSDNVGYWKNVATIIFNGQEYVDERWNDGHVYRSEATGKRIEVPINPSIGLPDGADSIADIQAFLASPPTAMTFDGNEYPLELPQNAKIWFYYSGGAGPYGPTEVTSVWEAGGNIEAVQLGTYTAALGEDNNLFYYHVFDSSDQTSTNCSEYKKDGKNAQAVRKVGSSWEWDIVISGQGSDCKFGKVLGQTNFVSENNDEEFEVGQTVTAYLNSLSNPTLSWKTITTLELDIDGDGTREQFIDPRWDDTNRYFLDNDPQACYIKIEDFEIHITESFSDNIGHINNSDTRSITPVFVSTNGSTRQQCSGGVTESLGGGYIPYTKSLGQTNRANSRIWFVGTTDGLNARPFWLEADNSSAYGLYTRATNTAGEAYTYVGCNNTSSMLTPPAGGSSRFLAWNLRNPSCSTGVASVSILIDNSAYAAVASGSTVGGSTEFSTDAPDAQCEGTSTLGWILCPIIEGLDDAIGVMYRVVVGELSVFSDETTGTSNGRLIDLESESGNDVYEIWQGFRNIARVLLVIALLVIVYAQIAGSSILDAYNVRKMLPKLAIAVIGIELSWFIFTEFAILVEDVARGIPSLLFNAIGGAPTLALEVNANLGIAGGLGLFAIIAFALPTFLIGIVPIALSVALAVLIAFFVLVLRRLILVMLLVLAPVALVLWIIPGTQGMAKKWFQSYQNLLFMYPLIMLLVAGGAVLSQVAGKFEVNQDMEIQDTMLLLTGIIAYFAPYFMIPLTFKWAGGAVAGVAGFMNNKSKGFIDRSRKKADEKKAFYQSKKLHDLPSEAPKGAWNRMKYMRNRKIAGLKFGTPDSDTLGGLQERQKLAQASKMFGDIARYDLDTDSAGLRSAAGQIDTRNPGAVDSFLAANGVAGGAASSDFLNYRRAHIGNDPVTGLPKPFGQDDLMDAVMYERLSSGSSAQQTAAAEYLTTRSSTGIDAIRQRKIQIAGMAPGAAKDKAIRSFQSALQTSMPTILAKGKDIVKGNYRGGDPVVETNENIASLASSESGAGFAGMDDTTHERLANLVMANADIGTSGKPEYSASGVATATAKALTSALATNATFKEGMLERHISALSTPGVVVSGEVKRALNAELQRRGLKRLL